MSFWPGKGLFASRHKRIQRIRVVWRPPERINTSDTVDAIDDQPKKELSSSEVQRKGSKTKNNQEKSSSSKQGDKKKSNFEKKSNRGRKRRNVKPIIDQSSNSDGSEKLGAKSDGAGQDEDDEIADEKGLSEASTDDIPIVKKKARKKRFGRRSKKSTNRDNPPIVKEEYETKLTLNKIHDVGGSEDALDRLERDWEDAGDSGGQISRCSSSSSLSSSCSHHSLIKHYTNIMMNCCDDQFDEDCNVVKNKIDRILKSQWKDRLNRSKEKPLDSSDSPSPISQPALKHSSSFKLRPARLPLNKKTWSKLKKSNQNSDWLFNNES